MVAVLLRFCKAPQNDEIALQHFFFFLTAVQEFFFYYICGRCNFSLLTSACRKFFFKITHPPPPQELNGRPLALFPLLISDMFWVRCLLRKEHIFTGNFGLTSSVLIYYAIPVRRELTFVKISSLKHIPSLLHLWIVICKRHCKTPTTLCSGPLPRRASITVILNLSILRSTFETTTLFKVSAGCNYSKNLKFNFE